MLVPLCVRPEARIIHAPFFVGEAFHDIFSKRRFFAVGAFWEWPSSADKGFFILALEKLPVNIGSDACQATVPSERARKRLLLRDIAWKSAVRVPTIRIPLTLRGSLNIFCATVEASRSKPGLGMVTNSESVAMQKKEEATMDLAFKALLDASKNSLISNDF